MGFEMPETTLTRAELLTERGYQENRAQNSTAPTVDRECSNCHGLIPTDRPRTSTTCSAECSDAWRITQRRRRDARRRRPSATPNPSQGQALKASSPTILGVLGVLGAVDDVDIVSIEFGFGSQHWLLTRQQ
jgi:hypothetical protein